MIELRYAAHRRRGRYAVSAGNGEQASGPGLVGSTWNIPVRITIIF
jgi:hypothetical protein